MCASKARPEFISVIMPIYNSDNRLLYKAVWSILEQDHENFELIIVEDPSPRIASGTIAGFRDPRIRYILNKKRTSFPSQLNQCLEMSGSNYAARMDGDDIAEPNRLSCQFEFMNRHQEISLVGTNLKIINESDRVMGIRVYPENPKQIALKMRKLNAVAHPSVLFRKEDIIELGGFRTEFGLLADYDLWCRMILAGKSLYNIQKPLLRYRIHTQASKVTSLKKTIKTTMEIKRRHFKGKEGLWGVGETIRYGFEQVLMVVPDSIILRMFMKLTVRKK